MSSHTPGPWGYEDPMGPDILTIVANPDAPVYDWVWIAQISTKPDEDDDGTVRDNRSFEEHEANARLIAAAPDLLDALKNVMSAIGEWSRPTGANGMTSPDPSHPLLVAREVARAAISKAGGAS